MPRVKIESLRLGLLKVKPSLKDSSFKHVLLVWAGAPIL